MTALIVAPLTAIATHTFNDVPNTHSFHEDIEWLEASGVTKGCNPPTNTLYCANDNVTRGQMAACMERFAGYLGAKDGTPAQADNATTADHATTAGGADHATTAQTSNRAEGVSQVRRVVDTSTPLDLTDGLPRSHTATCPTGFVAMGGGGFSSHVEVVMEDSRPTPTGTGWQVLYRNVRGTTAVNYNATVYVTCIQADETVLADATMEGLDTVGDKLD